MCLWWLRESRDLYALCLKLVRTQFTQRAEGLEQKSRSSSIEEAPSPVKVVRYPSSSDDDRRRRREGKKARKEARKDRRKENSYTPFVVEPWAAARFLVMDTINCYNAGTEEQAWASVQRCISRARCHTESAFRAYSRFAALTLVRHLALPGAPRPSRPAPARRRHPTHA